jgi:hypothetical protein
MSKKKRRKVLFITIVIDDIHLKEDLVKSSLSCFTMCSCFNLRQHVLHNFVHVYNESVWLCSDV